MTVSVSDDGLGPRGVARRLRRTFEALVPVVLVYKDVVCGPSVSQVRTHQRITASDSLRWFSRGAKVGGAKVKLCIWAVCGSNGRPPVSPGMFGVVNVRDHCWRAWCGWCRNGSGVGRVAPGRVGSLPIKSALRTALWPVARQDPVQKAGARLREGVEVGSKVRFLSGLEISATPGDV
jgi:hypothetical protein